jgi:hypothetical protein
MGAVVLNVYTHLLINLFLMLEDVHLNLLKLIELTTTETMNPAMSTGLHGLKIVRIEERGQHDVSGLPTLAALQKAERVRKVGGLLSCLDEAESGIGTM